MATNCVRTILGKYYTSPHVLLVYYCTAKARAVQEGPGGIFFQHGLKLVRIYKKYLAVLSACCPVCQPWSLQENPVLTISQSPGVLYLNKV